MKKPKDIILIVFLICFIPVFFFNTEVGANTDNIRITPVVKAVEKTKLSVVNISTLEKVDERVNPFTSFGRDPFFDRFFSNQYRKKSVKTHLGSGVIIDSQGYVLTNWHVVEKASSIIVATADEREFNAVLIGADPKSDIAVLKIKAEENFSQITLGNSEDILIGETVIAIGNPFGLSHTVTTGVVSALHRSIKANNQTYENFIQTDASINPGNSGGPLLNIKGELIGINTAIYGSAEGIGFAIPFSTAERIVRDLLEFGKVRPPWLGISVQDLTGDVAEHMGYRDKYGAIISEVFQGGPADKAGLLPADIIISIAGQKVKSKTSYKRIMGIYTADDSIKLKIYRQGTAMSVSVKASEFPVEYAETLCWDTFGIRIIDNSRIVAQKNNLYTSSGVVISKIKRGSQAHETGLMPGDIILKFQTMEIKSSSDLKKQIVNNVHLSSIVLLVQRGRYGYYVNLEMF